jgi:hypothetical protein
VISDSGAADQYLAGVVNCTIGGAGVGAERTLISADGSTTVECLETLNEATHRLSYILPTNTSFRNCLTTMAMRDLGLNQAKLVWSATFQPDGLPTDEAFGLMEGALAQNCLAL